MTVLSFGLSSSTRPDVVMMAGQDVSGGLRDALIENLNNILSPQAEVRRAAEEQIHVLEVTEGEMGGDDAKER